MTLRFLYFFLYYSSSSYFFFTVFMASAEGVKATGERGENKKNTSQSSLCVCLIIPSVPLQEPWQTSLERVVSRGRKLIVTIWAPSLIYLHHVTPSQFVCIECVLPLLWLTPKPTGSGFQKVSHPPWRRSPWSWWSREWWRALLRWCDPSSSPARCSGTRTGAPACTSPPRSCRPADRLQTQTFKLKLKQTKKPKRVCSTLHSVIPSFPKSSWSPLSARCTVSSDEHVSFQAVTISGAITPPH